MQSLLLENLVLGKKSNQQTKTMRTKTNYKPKAIDKGKENNAIFFETCKYPRAVHRMSLETFQMAQRIILSFNPIAKRLGKFERRF